MHVTNLFSALPDDLAVEHFETLLETPVLKIERIISNGQTSPESGWYDQAWGEWVMVMQGEAEITFDDGRVVRLKSGDAIDIPAHCRHRVSYTRGEPPTLWLAVHYAPSGGQ
ncbi:MAG: cupin domain-containing protein [Wenzhouxiangellaceae bacterium]